MSERERWIVYPLLFLALGAGLRDKLIDRTLSKSIVCQELIVYGEAGDHREPVKLVEIGATPRSSGNLSQVGQIVVNGQLRATAVSADNYIYRGFPIVPNVLRAIPGVLPANWLRALQQRAGALEHNADAGEQEREQPPPSEQPAAESNSS